MHHFGDISNQMLVVDAVFHFLELQSFIAHGRIIKLQKEASLSETRTALCQWCAPLRSLITVMLMEVKYLWRMCFLSPNLIFKLRFSNLIEMLITHVSPLPFRFFGRSKRSLRSHLFYEEWHIGGDDSCTRAVQAWEVEEIDKDLLSCQPRLLDHAEPVGLQNGFAQFDHDTQMNSFEIQFVLFKIPSPMH